MIEENAAVSDIVWTPARGENEPDVRSISWNNILLSDEVHGGKFLTSAEVRITPDTALQSTVFLAACRIISETVAGLPLLVYRRLKNGHEEIASEIPLSHVLGFAPNSWQTKFEFFEQMLMALTCWGNSYTEVKSGKYGSVTELNNLHPSRMRIERLENGRLKYSYNDPQTGRMMQYTQDQIMHVRWTPEPDGVKGMVPVEVSRDAIALARACEIYASKFWANMGRPGVVLQTDGALSAETAERLRENWERIHRGVQNAHRTAILTNGLKIEPFGATNNDSQFLEARKFQCEEIARCFRLPLHLIQGQSGGNLEVQGQEFVNYTLMPWLMRIEQSISRSLIYDDAVYYAKFDTKGLLRGDSGSRASWYSTMLNLGVLSINDIRRAEGYGPLGPEADTHLVAMNLQPLEEAVKPKPDPSMMPGFGSGAPAPAPGGPPSLSEVKTGKAPLESPKGEDSAKQRSESRELLPQDEKLEEAQQEIADEDGKWNKAAAHYIEKNPFASRGIKCHNCTHYVEEGGCKVVSGSIDDDAICKLWVIPTEKIADGPEQRAFCPTGEGGGVKNDCGSKDGGGPAAESDGKKTKGGDFPIANSLPKEVPAGHESLSEYVPFRPVPEGSGNSAFAVPPSDEDLAQALIGSNKSKGTKIGKAKELPEGTSVALRIDIPAFNHSTDNMGKSVYAITVHEDKGGKSKGFGSPIGYEPMARLSGPVRFDSKENEAVRVATGETTKTPLATVKGKYTQDRTIPPDIDTWTPVGFDPKKAAYFYDKKTGDEILSGTDAVSVGNTVFTRNPQRGTRNAKTHYRSLEEMMAVDSWGLESRGFCPTGEGGGIDNSCGDEDGSSSGGNDSGGDSPSNCPKPCHDADVEADKNQDGVTDKARVGVPAMDVPPPPPIPRIPNLDSRARAVEESFIAHYEDDPEGVAKQFGELVASMGDPPTFGTDDAKCLTDAWSDPDPESRAENRATLNTCLHQAANAIAKRAFLQHLDTLKEGDSIMVTVGGCGAGKGFALKNNPKALEQKSQSKAVWDSAGDQNATENPWILAEAEKRGLKATFVYVHADPEKQWADPERGVVKRASDPKDGRMVDAKVFADSYAIGAKNHHAFHQANKDNPNASFVFLDNTGKPKEVSGVPDEALAYDSAKLAEFAERTVEKSSAPDRVKTGALQGRKIWGKAKKK